MQDDPFAMRGIGVPSPQAIRSLRTGCAALDLGCVPTAANEGVHVMSVTERRADLPGAPRTSVIHLPVELDLAGVVDLRSMIADAVLEGSGAIVFDCARLTFIDASGIGALVRTANAVAAAGREVRLLHAGTAMCRMLLLTGVARRFVVVGG